MDEILQTSYTFDILTNYAEAMHDVHLKLLQNNNNNNNKTYETRDRYKRYFNYT